MNTERLQDVLAKYKADFTDGWWDGRDHDEKFKWEALKCFRDNWNIEAEDFPAMLKAALAETGTLLVGANRFPAQMILAFAENEPEAVRAMFRALYDEETNVFERIAAFKEQAKARLQSFRENVYNSKMHYQDEMTISVYLWLQRPETYYLYKYSVAKALSETFFDAAYPIVKGQYEENLRSNDAIMTELTAALAEDAELVQLVESSLTPECGADPALHTLAFDVGYYLYQHYLHLDDWWPKEKDYDPGLTAEDWLKYLCDPSVCTPNALAALSRLQQEEDGASCLELSRRYGQEMNFYNTNFASFAARVQKASGCPVCTDTKGNGLLAVPYLIRKAASHEEGSWIFKLRPALLEALDRLDGDARPALPDPVPVPPPHDPYTREDFLREVFMTEEAYEDIKAILTRKKNIILAGAPGVGKTFAAKRLAYSLMGEKDGTRIASVQFHQSYSYEDFIMGFRPTETGFMLKTGAFYDLCERARADQDHDYFFLIDEINRGNLSKIFGELLVLLEADKRGPEHAVRLLYRDEAFYVPKNLFVIGLMNTADRSLALMDYALRRRFAFIDMAPAFDSAQFRAYQASLGSARFDAVIDAVRALNAKIAEDENLGEGFSIGHSYFCGIEPGKADAELPGILKYEILPLLAEYWFDEKDTCREQADKLKAAVK